MSFKATLFLNEKEYPIIEMDYQLRQYMDTTGRPNTRVFGGMISLSCAATSDDSLLYEAMFSENQTISGSITVFKRDGMQKDFEIKFANTFVISLDTRFNHQTNENLMMDIGLSALIMEIKNTLYESPVNPNNPFIKEVVPLTEREERGKLIEYYLTDEDGKRIEHYELGDVITTNLIFESSLGEQFSFSLNDPDFDFEYNGTRLKNDTIEQMKITEEHIQIDLKVIEATTND